MQTDVPAASCLSGTGATVVYNVTFDDERTGVTVLHKDDMMVYKLSGFGQVASDEFHGLEAYMRMVRYAKSQGVRRVLVDVISNPGGLISLASLLSGLFTHNHDERAICPGYSKRITPGTVRYLEAYGREGLEGLLHPEDSWMGLPRTLARALGDERATLAVARLYINSSLTYEEHLLDAAVASGFTAPDGAGESFAEVRRALQSAATKEELLRAYARHLQRKRWLPHDVYRSPMLMSRVSICANRGAAPPLVVEAVERLYGSCGDLHENVSSPGWAPFFGDEIVDRDTLAPFAALEHLLEPVGQSWGRGGPSNYSKRGLFGNANCPLAAFEPLRDVLLSNAALGGMEYWLFQYLQSPEEVDSMIRDASDFEWGDIAVLTDGLGGSSSAHFTTVLLSSGKATLYSYGGLPGQAMDTSGFAGGNVRDWSFVWASSLYGALYAMFLDDDTDWARWHNDRELAHAMPMPTAATSSFNFNMKFILEFDRGTTTLPREYYRVPASKHFRRWAPLNADICDLPDVLFQFYDAVGQDDWCAVRQNPPNALAHGWACSSASRCAPPGMTCGELRERYRSMACCGRPDSRFSERMTCGDAMQAYNANECCGQPGRPATGVS